MRAYLPTLLAASDAGAATPLVREALEAGQCLVIFDGLDEAPPDRRRLVRMGIEAFARRHANNRFLVTCRVRSYQGERGYRASLTLRWHRSIRPRSKRS